ncbi:hypothetical protein [Hymenobacter bucti]|uniref:DUF937 domain-containing protein n=1 Tax=Hymenobacter bucti TaxID=1844114 RepID=A0ABW4QQ53_9BACT
MEPTSHQPLGSIVGPNNGLSHSANTAPGEASFSTTAAHATGSNPYPTDASAPQPATSGVKAKLDNALESGKKWLSDSGVAEQAQQLPQKAKEIGNKALTGINGLTTTQKAVSVGLLAAGVAFLLTRGKSKKTKGEYRDRPRKSPFDHQPHTKDGDHAYDRKGQRPWGNSRYGAGPGPAGKARVSSGSGYTSSPTSSHSNDLGRQAPGSRSHAPAPGPRRDQGPASGSRYDANTSGGQNPNNLNG